MRDPARRERILAFVEETVRRDGRAPSYREIGAALGIKAVSHIKFHLDALEAQGLLVREGEGARALRPARWPGVPVLGRIAAGEPIERFPENERDELDIGAHLRDVEQYALLVRGDSMIEDRIFDGDYLLVRPAKSAENGQIVVATQTFQGSAATVKRLFREPQHGRIRLQPANAAMEPIYVPAAEWDREWELQGVVMGVYRTV
jgi:repressor LexA